jgi:uncharacterized SAM-binding protein YcdF (DUF218 family)
VNPVVEVIKEFLIPGSAWFLIIAASLATGLLYGSPRSQAVGRRTLIALLAVYWLMSLPFIAVLAQRAQRGRAITDATGVPHDPLPIVVLGNGLGGYAALGGRIELPLGQTAMNTLFALDRYRRAPGSIIIASGGSQPNDPQGAPEAVVIRDALVRNGVPPHDILLEAASATTREQALETVAILKARGARACILVTSSQQMPRATELFERQGVTVIPLRAGSTLWSPSGRRSWSWLVPSAQARAISRDVLYELMAWPYYWMRGWVG